MSIRAFLILSSLTFTFKVYSQCTPAAADLCKNASVFCSIHELNGYTCSNPKYKNPNQCQASCSNAKSNNVSWWAFTGVEGKQCITITSSNCSVNGSGLQCGIWADCNCSQSIACYAKCDRSKSIELCTEFNPCKIYYFYVDGCNGDICDFTINTHIGQPYDPKPFDMNISGPITLCKGACSISYELILDKEEIKCDRYWEWTIDGVILDSNKPKINLDFLDEGTFTLCVTRIIGNPQTGSICDMDGPRCISIKVIENEILKANSERIICPNQIPLSWGNIIITSEGEYKQRFNSSCCQVDSFVKFSIQLMNPSPTKYFLGCIGEKYVEPSTGQTFTTCQNGTVVFIANKGVTGCDSSYNLVAAFINGTGRIREYCKDGMILLEVSPIDRTCSDGGYVAEFYTYRWYKKSDPSPNSLGSDEFIEVDMKDDYCVDITINGRLSKEIKNCKFTVCEQFNEDDFKPKKICPRGEIITCKGSTITFNVDTTFPADARHIWTVNGCTIKTQDPIRNNNIDILFDFDPSPALEYTAIVCYHLESSCPPSEECCRDIRVITKVNAGNDASTFLKTYNLKAENILTGQWSTISGPGTAIFKNPTSPNSQVKVNKFGVYKLRWTLDCNHGIWDDVIITFGKIKPDTGTKNDTIQQDSLRGRLIKNSTPITIYPNPTYMNQIYIEGGIYNSIDQIIIADFNGKLIYQANIQWNNKQELINLPNEMTTGIYIMKIVGSTHEVIVKRLIRL